MLLEMYYHVLLVLFLSTGTSLCGASKNARFGLRGLEGRGGSKPAPSYEKDMPELKRRQRSTVAGSMVTVTLGPETDITQITEEVTILPSSAPPVVITQTITSQTSVPPPQPTSTSLPSSTLSTSSTPQSSPTITSVARIVCDTGYSLCAAEYNGGCCKDGYTCAISTCIPPATATGEQRTCATGSYLCPASVNYGCCPGGYNCGVGECLAIGQMTYTSIATVITNIGGYTVTSTISSVIAGSTLGKAAESDLAAKKPTKTASTSLSPTTSRTGTEIALSGIAIGGIVAGCVIGILVFVIVGWFTYRRIRSRSNIDPPVGVTTTNFFDPRTATIRRTPGSGSSDHYGVTQEHDIFPKQQINHHPILQPPQGVVEMPENQISYLQQGHPGRWDGVPQNIGELPGDDRRSMHEVEGTTPVRSTRRWSRPFQRYSDQY